MSLAEVKKQYLEYLQRSAIELATVHPREKFTVEGVINQAKQKLATLKPELIRLVLGDSLAVYIEQGIDLSSQLSTITSDPDNSNVAVVDFMELEKNLMKEIYPQDKIKGYNFNSTTVGILNNAMLDLRTFLGASFIPPITPKGSDYRSFQNYDEALEHLKQLLQSNYQNDLKTLFLAKRMNLLTESAMNKHDKLVFFVTNASGNMAGIDQIAGRNVNITSDDEVPTTPEQLQALVASKLKPKTVKPKTKTNKEN